VPARTDAKVKAAATCTVRSNAFTPPAREASSAKPAGARVAKQAPGGQGPPVTNLTTAQTSDGTDVRRQDAAWGLVLGGVPAPRSFAYANSAPRYSLRSGPCNDVTNRLVMSVQSPLAKRARRSRRGEGLRSKPRGARPPCNQSHDGTDVSHPSPLPAPAGKGGGFALPRPAPVSPGNGGGVLERGKGGGTLLRARA
jgi:hypothetical protein